MVYHVEFYPISRILIFKLKSKLIKKSLSVWRVNCTLRNIFEFARTTPSRTFSAAWTTMSLSLIAPLMIKICLSLYFERYFFFDILYFIIITTNYHYFLFSFMSSNNLSSLSHLKNWSSVYPSPFNEPPHI